MTQRLAEAVIMLALFVPAALALGADSLLRRWRMRRRFTPDQWKALCRVRRKVRR